MAKNVSNNFKNVIKAGGPFYTYATVTLKDGTELTYTSESDFTISGTEYSEGIESGFSLGEAVSKMITLNLDNTDAQNDYDYYYARITLYTEADMPDGTVERIREGIFTVIDSVAPGETLEITAYDDMYKSDIAFTSTLSYPVSAQQLLNEVCSKCDITLGSATFANNNFQILTPPEGLTGRQVIGYIAQIAGGNAVIDRTGHLIIKTYNVSGFDTQETVTPGEIESESGIHIISEFTQDPEIGTDDVTITGVTVTIESDDYDTEDEVYTSGTDEYAIKIDNPLISGQEKAAVDLIADIVVGITTRPFSGAFMPDPTIEFMDLAYVVDRKGNAYKSFVTTHDFAYLSNSTISCSVESPERHGASYHSNASEVYQKAKEGLKENKTQWEQAIEDLANRVGISSGLYTTEELQPDGSTIFYLHNKQTLKESDIIWKMTAETLTVSTDGGKSWNAGITVDGEVIARIMNTIGINFDWGVGGTLIIQDNDGNQTAYIDAETGTIRLSVQSLTITGKTVQEIAAEQSDSAINDFVDAVYNPGISGLQAQIDGQIETYYYDYEPTLANEPASEWTAETERQKHEGDLFYWKSKGYAYRFFKDGNTWKWQMVQDTDITKALEQAATAQDTADQKRRVFIATPTPPYDVGDLWTQGTAGDIMRCKTARQSGNYNSADWVKASKYTDDSFAEEVQKELQNLQIGGRNILLDSNAPSLSAQAASQSRRFQAAITSSSNYDCAWASISDAPQGIKYGAQIKVNVASSSNNYQGLLFYNSSGPELTNGENYTASWYARCTQGTAYTRFELYSHHSSSGTLITSDWKRYSYTFQFDDSKSSNPTYAIFQTNIHYAGTIQMCGFKLEKGNKATDWTPAPEDTDTYIDDLVTDLQDQLDGKVETWYQSSDPSSAWTTTDLKNKHTGDIWYKTSTGKSYRWNGTSWQETKSTPPDEVFDEIDGKAQIFIITPKPPYYQGDLWFNSTTSDIMTCIKDRTSGSYTASDWQKRNKYTDDSAVDNLDNALDQEGVFNRLTSNGAVKGIYMIGNQLYVNASYIKSGTLVLGGSSNGNGTLSLRNASNTQIALLNNTGLSVYSGGRIFVGNSNNSGNSAILTNGSLDFYRDNVHMARISSDNYADGSVGFSVRNYSGTDFVQFVNNSNVWMQYVPKSGSISGVQVDANTLYTFCNLHLQNTIDLSSAQITASPLRINGNTVTDFITGSSTYSDGGRIELGGGILIQWGAAVFGSSGFATVDFPVAYSSTTSYIILASPQYASSFVGAAFSTSRQSASRAYIYLRDVNGNIISGGGGVNWIAIGLEA